MTGKKGRSGGARPGAGRPAKLTDPQTVSIRVDDDTHAALIAAQKTLKYDSMSDMVRDWIESALDEDRKEI